MASSRTRLALMVLAHKSSTDEIIELRKAFNEFDTERNGTISLNEFRAGMEKSGNVSNSYTRFCCVDTRN